MDMEDTSMKLFLSSAKSLLRNCRKPNKVCVVLGNETCDMDSAVSSLVYSYFLHNLNPSNENIVIPVFNISRADISIKTEVTYLLNKHGISLDVIICRDEIDLDILQSIGSLQLILVDHHVLNQENQLISSVVAVIDHRPPDPAWPWDNVDSTLNIVGSCCTLVADKLFSQAPHLVSPMNAMWLLGAILLDTACLCVRAGKTTPLDIQMAEKLCTYLPLTFDKEQLYKELYVAKTDISTLTSAQLLKKDFKMASGIPIAGLPIKVKEFLQRDDATSAARQFCEEHNAELCVIYGLGEQEGNMTKDIAVFALNNLEAAGMVIKALLNCREPCLNLQILTCSLQGFTLFEQLNITASRKQFLPIIQEVVEIIKKNKK